MKKPGPAAAGGPAAKRAANKLGAKKPSVNKASAKKVEAGGGTGARMPPADDAAESGAGILDRLHLTIVDRRTADPARSHSARLLARGAAKVAQKFGEEAVECLIEAVANNPAALVDESADVLYHLVVMWVAAGVEPEQVWAELRRREGMSGVDEKASRPTTAKIP